MFVGLIKDTKDIKYIKFEILKMTTDWLLRVGDGENLKNSSKYRIWGIQALTSPHGKYFIQTSSLETDYGL